METTKYKLSQGGIQIFPHHLQIPGNAKIGTQNLTIREQVMNRYADFVEHWNIAISQATVNPSVTFAQLWITDQTFRAEMIAGLKALGVEEPEMILPSHLQELLLICNVEGDSDVRPLVFRLHSDAPDPKRMGQGMKDGKPSTSGPSTPQNTWHQRFLTTLKQGRS